GVEGARSALPRLGQLPKDRAVSPASNRASERSMSTHSSEFLHTNPTAKTSVRHDVPQIRGHRSENLVIPDEAERHFADELIFQRSVQVYLAAVPAVSMMAMRDSAEKAVGPGHNVLLTSLPGRNGAHPSAMSCLDLGRDGPLIVTVPAG